VKGWITAGMFSIGKMNPDKYIIGVITKNVAVIIACCCVFEIVEMKRPRPSVVSSRCSSSRTAAAGCRAAGS
jgi:hypothetical protein